MAEIAEFALLVVPFASLLAAHSDLGRKGKIPLQLFRARSAELVDATRQSQDKM